MPRAKDVNPVKWTNKIVLYDDNIYSVCWGNYEGSLKRRLGVRWNDNFPRQGNNPTWYVEYDFFCKEYIQILIDKLNKLNGFEEEERRGILSAEGRILSNSEISEYLENCTKAIKEIENNEQKD